MFDPDLLLSQLAELGRLLDSEVDKLADLDIDATAKALIFARVREQYEDELAVAFLMHEGSVEVRKMQARIDCRDTRTEMGEASVEWEHAKSALRNQQAVIRAIHSRIDVGRSLLSTEKARMDLDRLPEPR